MCLQVITGHRPVLQTAFKRVPFQEDTDNIKNFPNMKVFHAFKKQRYMYIYIYTVRYFTITMSLQCTHTCRDSFYSVLREWEAHHETPNWHFQSALRDKIRCSPH